MAEENREWFIFVPSVHKLSGLNVLLVPGVSAIAESRNGYSSAKSEFKK
jgi:hypothetical protein